MKNETIFQDFEWYLPEDAAHWRRCAEAAAQLAQDGVTMAWLPPAYKGAAGRADVGYGVYDTYDLGEFDQKGSVPTKYGTKDEYLEAIHALQAAGVKVMADIVLNQRMGADETEDVQGMAENPANRLEETSPEKPLRVWTKFTFPGRAGKYSTFQWNHTHFDGVDWDENSRQSTVYLLAGKGWDSEVDMENVNYDYLMGADVDMEDGAVNEELLRWGRWYLDLTGVDCLRLDAVKHIDFDFFGGWLGQMRAHTGKPLFAVGEYWSQKLDKLTHYLDRTGGIMRLFDVPLHFNFYNAAASGGQFDMRTLMQNTLVACREQSAVTFVDNHDTQPGQALQSFVQPWFKPLAYAVILLQKWGVPCVFYGDYYGIPHDNLPPVAQLPALMRLRQSHALGEQHDYYDNENLVGFTREGEDAASGLAVLLSDGVGGQKRMYVGAAHAGQVFVDALGVCPEEITIESDGNGTFRAEGGSVSVWVPRRQKANTPHPAGRV